MDNPRNDVEDESKMLLLRGKSISRLSLVVRRAVQWVILLRFSYFPVTVHTLFGRALSLSVFCVAPFFFSATVPGGNHWQLAAETGSYSRLQQLLTFSRFFSALIVTCTFAQDACIVSAKILP